MNFKKNMIILMKGTNYRKKGLSKNLCLAINVLIGKVILINDSLDYKKISTPQPHPLQK